MSIRKNIHEFFEKPHSVAACLFQGILFVATVWVVALSVLHFVNPLWLETHPWTIWTETPIFYLFLFEYVLRLLTAEQPLQWFIRPLNLVDLVVVALGGTHFVFGNFTDTLSLRALRLVRLFRVISLVKLFKQYKSLNRVLVYEGTILEAITPVILVMMALKGGVWTLEHFGYWLKSPNLGDLFAIIGFALGIILSQKIGVTYQKFVQVDEVLVRLSSNLNSLGHILKKYSGSAQKETISQWAATFLALLKNPTASSAGLETVNEKLYEKVSQLEGSAGEISTFYASLCEDAFFCLAKKSRLTPKAYDTLLHQATLLYLVLITLFIPSITGMISILIASYILYGMYRLTQDLDSILGGDYQLINIDLSLIEEHVQ